MTKNTSANVDTSVKDLTDAAVKQAKLLASLADNPELLATLGIDSSVLQSVQAEVSQVAAAKNVLRKMEDVTDSDTANEIVELSRELAALTADHIKLGKAGSDGRATRSFTIQTEHGAFRVALV